MERTRKSELTAQRAGSELLAKLLEEVQREDSNHDPEWKLWSKGVLGELT